MKRPPYFRSGSLIVIVRQFNSFPHMVSRWIWWSCFQLVAHFLNLRSVCKAAGGVGSHCRLLGNINKVSTPSSQLEPKLLFRPSAHKWRENPNSTSQSESMWSSLVISTEDALIVVAVYAARSIHVCQSSISNPKIIKSCSTIIFRFIFYNYFGKSVRLRRISEEVYHWWVTLTSNLKESSTRSSVNNAKDWLDQLFLFPGLVCKRLSPMDVITRGHSTTIFLCTKPFSA